MSGFSKENYCIMYELRRPETESRRVNELNDRLVYYFSFYLLLWHDKLLKKMEEEGKYIAVGEKVRSLRK